METGLDIPLIDRSDTAEKQSRELALCEAALHPQMKLLPSILNTIEDGVVVVDTRGNILFFNPESERLLRTTLTGSRIEECFQQYETAYPAGEHILNKALRGESVQGTEMFLRHPKIPEGIWLTVSAQPLTDPQRLVRGAIFVLTDISKSKLLEKQIAEISEREQRRIGQDLHDGLCQELVSASLTCGVLSQQLKHMPQVETVKQLATLLDDCIGQARALARAFYPVRLEVDGLASALDELAAMAERRSGIRCRFTCDRRPTIQDHVAEVTLYRIVQEAVANAVKHSQAQEIAIGLEAVEDEITLTIADDGLGMAPRAHHGGMGLHMMRYRARVIGASLDIRPGPSSGTVVSCFFQNSEPPKTL